MTKPRRPILAAVCAALLLAAVGIWIHSCAHLAAARRVWADGIAWAVGYQEGLIFVHRFMIPVGFDNTVGSDALISDSTSGFHNPFAAWFHFYRTPGDCCVIAPGWFLPIVPVTGLWWSWRRPKPSAGFPVEPVKETA